MWSLARHESLDKGILIYFYNFHKGKGKSTYRNYRITGNFFTKVIIETILLK